VSLFVCALSLVSASEFRRPAPQQVKVTDGVYLFSTKPYGDVGLDGNSIAITSPAGVLVFDTNGTPAAASAVLDGIQKLTDRPVRYVVNSHWHWDHWYGTETYLKAFPEVQVVSHEKTREMMMGPALAFNEPGISRDLPNYLDALAKKAETTPSLQPLLEEDRFFLEQKRSVHHVFPTTTFSDRLNIDLGGREVQVLHYDRAVTPGDAFLYLPKEKIVITGDLLVNPVSFALSCYPSGWLRSLEKIDALDATVIVPGHGMPLHDKTLLHATMDVFRVLLREGRAAKDRGLAVDDARAAIFPQLHDAMVKITGDDAKTNSAFQVQLVDWFLHRVYDELDGPLTDAIAPIPRM
jgi:glyoxylase-like metal-dependent hydrolase (beta-lactamase superfamily II)